MTLNAAKQKPDQQQDAQPDQPGAPRRETDYRVELDAYEGPLDLLLYLVKRHEIDLYDIPIAELTEQYLGHIKEIEAFDIERAGDFLVMAATLLEIKSQMLVPRLAGDDEEDEQADDSPLNTGDPRYELVQQLLAYKRFKDAAMDLEDRLDDWQARFTAKSSKRKVTAEDADTTAEAVSFDMDDVDVHVLCQAFARILDSIGRPTMHEVEYDDTPISLHEEDILDRLKRDGPTSGMTLRQIFEGRKGRSEMIGLFLALLELTRQRKIRVVQDKSLGEINLILREDEAEPVDDETHADWRDPDTGEIQYEWPDEKTKERIEQRAKRRAARVDKIRRGETVEDDSDDIIDVDGEDDSDDDE